MKTDKVLVFTCNWNAYWGMETAGFQHRTYSVAIHSLKVVCLGRLNPGVILKAFEHGAAGVLLLGCPQNECQYQFGHRRAEEMFAVAARLSQLLGYSPQHLLMDHVVGGDGEGWVEKVQSFVAGLNAERGAP